MNDKLGFRLSRQVTSTLSPPIPQAYKWAESYIPSNERRLLDMSQGVPGIAPPEDLLSAVSIAAASPSSCGYCPVSGEPLLRRALAEEMKEVYGREADVTAKDIVLTAGCNMAFVVTIMSLADAGDEVILPVPWYFNHQMTLNMLGITTVPLVTTAKNGFRPSVKLAATLITSKTKAIALVSPNNPTGAIYPATLIADFKSLAKDNNIALIVDETYRDFITSGPPHRIFSPVSERDYSDGQIDAPLASSTTWRSNFIHLFSFSKSYCIPGHRLGAIAAAPDALKAITTVLDSIQICPPRPIQIALSPLLSTFRPFIVQHAKSITSRHELFRTVLPPRWRIGSQGGFFAFVKHPFKGISATDVSRRLAQEMGVITLPAEFFCPAKVKNTGEWNGESKSMETIIPSDDDMWIRFSVANVDDEKVKRVCERLAECEERFGWEVDFN